MKRYKNLLGYYVYKCDGKGNEVNLFYSKHCKSYRVIRMENWRVVDEQVTRTSVQAKDFFRKFQKQLNLK